MGFGKLAKGIVKRSNPKNVIKHTIRTVTDPVGAAMESANVVGEDVDNLSGGRILNGEPLIGGSAPAPQTAMPARRPMQLSPGAQAIYDRMQNRQQGGAPVAAPVRAQPAPARGVVIPNGGVRPAVAAAAQPLGLNQQQQGILTMADGGIVPHTANKSGSHKKNGKPC